MSNPSYVIDDPHKSVIENKAEIMHLFNGIMQLAGIDPTTPDTQRTPERFWEVLEVATRGYSREVTVDRCYDDCANEEYPVMRISKGIPFLSFCVGRRSMIPTVNGVKQAHQIRLGEELITLVGGKKVKTTVRSILPVDTKTKIRLETEKYPLELHPKHPAFTQDGYKSAELIEPGDVLAWTNVKKFNRTIYPVKTTGYSLGYILGSLHSDGTLSDKIHQRIVRLQAKSRSFVDKYAYHFEQVFSKSLTVDKVDHYGEWNPLVMYRAQCCDIDIIEKLQSLLEAPVPLVVKSSEECMQGYLDGYVDGDGTNKDTYPVISSMNEDRIGELAYELNKNYSTAVQSGQNFLYIGKHPLTKFTTEVHELNLQDFSFEPVEVLDVRKITTTKRPYRLLSFECYPYPTYIAQGFLQKNCEHHWMPFLGTCDVAYIPGGRVTGMSKIPQVVEKYANRFQNQERMTEQIAEELWTKISPEPMGIMVVTRAIHTCERVEGYRRDGPYICSSIRGIFTKEVSPRDEALRLLEISNDSV